MQGIFICVFVVVQGVSIYKNTHICVFVFVFEKSLSGLNWRRSRGRANETTAVNAPAIANVVDLTLVDNDRVDKNRGQ